jgi:hypothetical protein
MKRMTNNRNPIGFSCGDQFAMTQVFKVSLFSLSFSFIEFIYFFNSLNERGY